MKRRQPARHSTCAALAIGLSVLTPIAAGAAAVRTADAHVEALIAEGIERSATFRDLIERLDRTRWLVFVQRGRCPDATPYQGLRSAPIAPAACLLARGGTYENQPYVIVRLDVRYSQTPQQEISLIAHELQHAVEGAEAPGVIDAPTLIAFIKQTGEVSFRAGGVTGYETPAAIRTGNQVLHELRTSRKATAARVASSSSDRPHLTN